MDAARTKLEDCFKKIKIKQPEKVLGEEDPMTVDIKQSEVLVEEHPMTLGVMIHLANVYDQLGISDAATSKEMRLLSKRMFQMCYDVYYNKMGDRAINTPNPSCIIFLVG